MDFTQIGLIIFNIISPSTPEQMFYVFFTLFIMGESEFIKLNSRNIVRLLLCSVVVSIFSVYLRLTFPELMKNGILLPIGIIITWASILVAYRIFRVLSALKALVCVILSFVVIFVFQFSYVPLLMFGTDRDVEIVSQYGITTFLWSLPEVVMIFAAIGFISVKKNMYRDIKLIMVLTRNKVIMAVTIILLVFNVAFLATMFKLISIDKIIYNLPFISQLLIIAMVVMFPIINVTLLIIALYSNYYKETIRVLLSKDRLNTLVSILGVYAEEKNYEKVNSIVNDIHKHVHNI